MMKTTGMITKDTKMTSTMSKEMEALIDKYAELLEKKDELITAFEAHLDEADELLLLVLAEESVSSYLEGKILSYTERDVSYGLN